MNAGVQPGPTPTAMATGRQVVWIDEVGDVEFVVLIASTRTGPARYYMSRNEAIDLATMLRKVAKDIHPADTTPKRLWSPS